LVTKRYAHRCTKRNAIFDKRLINKGLKSHFDIAHRDLTVVQPWRKKDDPQEKTWLYSILDFSPGIDFT